MFSLVKLSAALGSILCALTAFADAAHPASGEVASLRAQVATCDACHQNVQDGATSLGPVLAGQKQGYLRKQLLAFRDGLRKNATMSPMAVGLNDALIDAVAAHYASLPLPAARSGGAALDPLSRPLVFCVRCHGADGISPNDIWPSLAGQQREYMSKQVEAFSSGARRDDMMRNWGSMVGPDDMNLILDYFSRLGPNLERGNK